MKFLLTLALIAAIAVIGAEISFIRKKLPLGTRHILLTGTEFIFVGFLLGPGILNFLDTQTIIDLHPFLSFGLGWIGFLFGLQFDFSKIKKLPKNYFSITLMQAFITLLIVFVSFYFLLNKFLNFDATSAFISALTLASVSACTGQTSMAIVHRDFHIPSRRLMNLYRYISGVDGLISIIVFGLVLCYHKTNTVDLVMLNHFASYQWFAISIALGIVMGYIFHLIAYIKINQDELLLIIIGLVTFAAGISLYLKLSPLFINFIMGLVVANITVKNIRILEIMIRAEKSIYILIVILAGASWQPTSFISIGMTILYFFVRLTGKFIGGFTAVKLFDTGFPIKPIMGLGLLSQGGIALAIIINFQQIFQHPSGQNILTIVILGAIINEMISPALVLRLVRN